MMRDLLRDSVLGQLLRGITRNRMLQYPEDSPGFTLPESFNLEKRATDSEGTIIPSAG
jgi:DHA1 family multidrug resistance protein-like MFS transporter